MRVVKYGLAGLPLWIAMAINACGGGGGTGFGSDGGSGSDGASGGPDSGGHPGDSSMPIGDTGVHLGGDGSGGHDGTTGDEVIVTTSTTVYANTDTELYSLDPKTNLVTLIGPFAGMGDGSYNAITDCAVNAEGDVYVNTETEVFKAAVPTSAGAVNLTSVATIATAKGQYFYALAFAPKDFLGSGETLIGGDNTGELYSIDPTSGALKNLGNFGGVPGSSSGDIFALSGDMVFYTDGKGMATGLATIRSCAAGGKTCTSTNDYLAGIDMTALSTAYTSGTPAASLLAGIYGGSSTSVGPGTGFGDIYGLGAWEGTVFGFTRAGKTATPDLISIDTTSGAGKLISSSFGFTSGGWSGAGVTTTTTITVPNPPPPPPQPH
jgi:hypothetical protein